MVRFDRYQALDDDEPTHGRFTVGTSPSSRMYGESSLQSWEADARATHVPRKKNTLSAVVVGVLAVLLVLVGLGLALVGDVQRNDDVLPICPNCHSVILGLMIAGGIVAFIGIVGVVAACTRARPLAFFFCGIMIILAIVFVAVGSVTVAVKTGAETADLRQMWTQTVKNDAAIVCSVQKKLECSGYDVPCANHTVVTARKTADQCSQECAVSNDYSTSCEHPLRSRIDRILVPLAAASFGTAVLMIVAAVASVRMTFRTKAV